MRSSASRSSSGTSSSETYERGGGGDVQRDVAGERDEVVVAGHEVGVAVDLDEHADLAVGVDVGLDRALGRLAPPSLAALAAPFTRSSSIGLVDVAARSPSSALLQSIIPAPVRSRRALTSLAVIVRRSSARLPPSGRPRRAASPRRRLGGRRSSVGDRRLGGACSGVGASAGSVRLGPRRASARLRARAGRLGRRLGRTASAAGASACGGPAASPPAASACWPRPGGALRPASSASRRACSSASRRARSSASRRACSSASARARSSSARNTARPSADDLADRAA